LERCAVITTLTVFGILSLFAMLRDLVLDAFGIGVNDVRIAGGMILLFFGLRMAGAIGEPKASGELVSGDPVSIAVSPLGMPMLAGPATISTVIVFSQIDETYFHGLALVLTIIAACAAVFMALQLAIFLGPRINATAAMLLNRMMGLIVASIAAGILTTGIRNDFGLG
jgi:multiple antibiotic resistance protein